MKTSLQVLAAVLSVAFMSPVWSQPLTVTTIAGRFGASDYTNGIGTNALFLGYPARLAADPAGSLYVLDGQSVRQITPDLAVTTLVGKPHIGGYYDGAGDSALFDFEPNDYGDVAVDTNGGVYVADNNNFAIRRISAGAVTTLAGNGYPGYKDGRGTNAQFLDPHAVALDLAGNVYVADQYRIRKITAAGVVTTLAGGASFGYNDGSGTNAQFAYANGLAVDAGGTVYVADGWGIRKITPAGDVTTWVGNPNTWTESDGVLTKAGFGGGAYKIALDHAGGAYVSNGDTIRYVSSAGVVSTVAGQAGARPIGSNDGVGTDARFASAVGIGVDAVGNVYIADSGEDTILKGTPPRLSAIGSFGYSTGGAPVRASNPWQFTAYYMNLVSDLRLRVQSTTTTNSEASWTDLPGNPQMTDVDGNWTLNTTDVPTGTRYFRVIASAPGYVDSPSAVVGPETVLDGIAPFGLLVWETTYPTQTGVPWRFTVTEASLVSDLRLRIQSRPTPDDLNGWTDLPGGGQMGHQEATWTLNTTNLPTGTQSFRVVASAPTYADRISATLGPFGIRGALPPVMKSDSTSGTYQLESIVGPDPQTVYFQAVQAAVVQFGCSDTVQYTSAVDLAGQQYAAAVLQIEAAQNVGILAVNMGQNSTLVLKGGIIGDVSLISQDGSGLISQDGSGVVSNDGGSLAYDQATAAVVSNDGGSLIGNSGSTIIGENSSGLLGPQYSGSLRPPATIARQGRRAPQGPPFQPPFTGLMTIQGNYSQFPGTTLVIGIAGANTLSDGAQQFDQLVVSGTANLLGGRIAFALFNPTDQTNQAGRFQPTDGATFDVVVATNIVLGAVQVQGPIWGDGMFFSGSVVTRPDGMQAVRLVATHVAPRLFLQTAGAQLQLVYPTNYAGYDVQSSPTLVAANWTPFSTGTNLVALNSTNAAQFFRLAKP